MDQNVSMGKHLRAAGGSGSGSRSRTKDEFKKKSIFKVNIEADAGQMATKLKV